MHIYIHSHQVVLMNLLLILRHVRRFFSSATSKIKKASASKRQRRDDDPNDEDYAPNQSDIAAKSSAVEDSDESMEGAHGSDDDEVIDVHSMNLPGRCWTAESYANARSMNQNSIKTETTCAILSYSGTTRCLFWPYDQENSVQSSNH